MREPDRVSAALLVVWACALTLVLPRVAAGSESSLRFTRFSVAQGLSQGTVEAILQDKTGFLWFGTEEGLNRFDGYSFRVFQHDPQDPTSLPHGMVSTLHEDRQGRLWVGTQSGLSVFDRRAETFARVSSVRERVSAIVEDADGALWVGTLGQGLYRRDPASGVFVQHTHDPQDPRSLASDVVWALCLDRRGRLWIGTRAAGLDLLEDPRADRPSSRRFVHHRHVPGDTRSLAHDEVRALAEARDGRLWVATRGGGLSVRDADGLSFRSHRAGGPGRLASDRPTCLLIDRAGTLWVGSGAGLQRYDASTDRFVTFRHDPADPESLSQSMIRAIHEDVQGNLWVGTYLGGVNLLKRSRHPFGYFTHRPSDSASLANAAVASFLEDAEGRIWIGTEGGWLHRYERRSGTFARYRFPSAEPEGSAVLALAQDRAGRIWAGVYRGGLARFDPERGRFLLYDHRPADSKVVNDDSVWAIVEGTDGALWLGTNTGLVRFDADKGEATLHHQTSSPAGVNYTGARALLNDRQGNLWVGTLAGLNLRLRGGRGFVRYRHDNADPRSLSSDAVVALHEDRHGRLWVGTLGGGLDRLDPETGAFTAYGDLPSKVVYRIEEDPSGHLWLSTNRGLSRLDPTTGHVTNYDLTNGLRSLQFHLGASLRTRDGRLLFGSAEGFYEFDPEDIRPDTWAPPVVFTSLRVMGDSAGRQMAIAIQDEVTLTNEHKAFSVEFAAMDYAIPRRNEYAYRMEGFGDEWVRLGARHDVTFANLDPGAYTLRVKASNSDGIWNEASVASVRIVVEPPLWHAWWFRGILAGAIALGLFAAHRVRVRHLTAMLEQRKQIELTLLQAEERYRAIFENAAEGIFQTTPDGRFLTANPAMTRMLGYGSCAELLAGVTDIEGQFYVQPRRRRELQKLLEEKGVVHGFECEVRRRDGCTLWISENVRAVRDEAGRTLYFEGTAQDISDRRCARQAEAALRDAVEKASEEWTRTFDSIAAYIFVLDERGTVVRVNRAVRDGASRPSYRECLGRPVTELGPGEPWRTARELAREVAYTASGTHAQVQDHATRRTWDLQATPLLGVEAGEARTIVVARDVTGSLEREGSLAG